MELRDAIRRRRMVRSFSTEPLDMALVDRLLTEALSAPTAGNTRGVSWLVLAAEETRLYWEHATTPAWRASSSRYRGLSAAPVIALSLCAPLLYLARYGEPDKAGSGLGLPTSPTSGNEGESAWPVPYWFGDAAFATMLALLGATEAGLAAAFLGNFRHERTLLGALAVPEQWRLFGAVVLGVRGDRDRPSPSLRRQPAPGAGVVYHSRWTAG